MVKRAPDEQVGNITTPTREGTKPMGRGREAVVGSWGGQQGRRGRRHGGAMEGPRVSEFSEVTKGETGQRRKSWCGGHSNPREKLLAGQGARRVDRHLQPVGM